MVDRCGDEGCCCVAFTFGLVTLTGVGDGGKAGQLGTPVRPDTGEVREEHRDDHHDRGDGREDRAANGGVRHEDALDTAGEGREPLAELRLERGYREKDGERGVSVCTDVNARTCEYMGALLEGSVVQGRDVGHRERRAQWRCCTLAKLGLWNWLRN